MRSLYDGSGDRKYTSHDERLAFFEATKQLEKESKRLFCSVLLHAGCRISEALALKRIQIDQGGKALVFLTLKQKGAIIHRPVPIPQELIDRLLALPVTKDGRLHLQALRVFRRRRRVYL